jgi:heme/copper-type cytochrome/quinol oxidase subunit 2
VSLLAAAVVIMVHRLADWVRSWALVIIVTIMAAVENLTLFCCVYYREEMVDRSELSTYRNGVTEIDPEPHVAWLLYPATFVMLVHSEV